LAWRQVAAGLEVSLRVTPNARTEQIGPVERRDDGRSYLSVKVRAIPDKGKANAAVLALFAKHFDLRKVDIEITKGQQARQKTLLVKANNTASWVQRLVDI